MYFDSKQIYKRVDQMRLDRGWSIYRLAELAGLSENSIYSWRDKNTMPKLNLIESIAEAFGVSPIVLLINNEETRAIGEEQRELIDLWNSLRKDQKKSMLELLRAFHREYD